MARSTPAQNERGAGQPQRPKRGDAARHRPRAEQRAPRGVRDRPDHDGGPPGRAVQQHRRLHVRGEGALAGQPLALAVGEQVVHGDDLAGVGPQPGPSQLGGQQRRGRAGDRGGRPDPADLSSDHEVTRLLISGDSPAGTGNRHGLERDAA
jgi:hypothetical protein